MFTMYRCFYTFYETFQVILAYFLVLENKLLEALFATPFFFFFWMGK